MSKAARLTAVITLSIGGMTGLLPPAVAVPVAPDPAVRATLIGGDRGTARRTSTPAGPLSAAILVGEGDGARTAALHVDARSASAARPAERRRLRVRRPHQPAR